MFFEARQASAGIYSPKNKLRLAGILMLDPELYRLQA
jgi:hypothetical protein